MVNQSCKFVSGDLVFESHGPELMSVYVALGCRNYFDRVDGAQVTRECLLGSEFFFYFGTIDRWGHDKNHENGEGSQVCSLPSNALNPWNGYMHICFDDSLDSVLQDNGKNIKWVSRVALWKHWIGDVSRDEMGARIPPRHEEILGDEYEALMDLFKLHFG